MYKHLFGHCQGILNKNNRIFENKIIKFKYVLILDHIFILNLKNKTCLNMEQNTYTQKNCFVAYVID